MNHFSRLILKRLCVVVVGLLTILGICVSLAVHVQQDASQKLRLLAQVELEAAVLARQFRNEIRALQGTLLRIGTRKPEDSAALIREKRASLGHWLALRNASPRSEAEKSILLNITKELDSYYAILDTMPLSTAEFTRKIDRNTVVILDDQAIRLEGKVDEFAAAHDERLRSLLQSSLSSLLWMRDLVFVCLTVLMAATLAVALLLYRDVIRPLRVQLMDSMVLLEKREKLAALGTLAAGVAHEIRNPLTAIRARIYTLRHALVDEESKQDAQAISNEVDRLEIIVRKVLGYARPASASLQPVELSAWLREFALFVEPELTASNIGLDLHIGATAHVDADSNQLRQVMLNLVRNAKEALGTTAGRIALALSLEHDRTSQAGNKAEVAVLSVSDNGPGIPANLQPRLFDPFFTTKPAGTGLGLSIVAQLVENQGGKIGFQSSPKIGTRFSIHLPISHSANNDQST